MLFTTPAECRAAMQKLLIDPALRAQLGARGRRMALAEWTEDVHIARYLELIGTLISQRTA